MIDEYYTWIFYGYHSDELSKGSQKPIVAVCDECCKYRIIPYQSYRDLCRKCSHKLNKFLGEKHHSFKGGKKVIFCDTCNKKIERYSSVTKDHKFHFCSHKCQVKWQKNKRIYKHRSKNDRILMSCGWQKISIDEFGGFLSDQKYCSKFNNSLKTKIRNNYNNCDYISGIHKDICNKGRSLDVHHVDYNKQQGCEDHEWKLIPLSHINHLRTNANRSFWNRLFTYSLQYEAEYYRDE